MLKVFIGGSSTQEAKEVLDIVSYYLREYGIEPIRWDNPGLFIPGAGTFERLQEIAKGEVDAAAFIFSEDDDIWYRADGAKSPRDNVLIEYGLFAGILGSKKTIVFKYGEPKIATDLGGIQYIDISEKRRERARIEISQWAKRLASNPIDAEKAKYLAKIRDLEVKLAEQKDISSFYKDVSNERGKELLRVGVYAQNDKYWKLLSDYKFISSYSSNAKDYFEYPIDWVNHCKNHQIDGIIDIINWEPHATDSTWIESIIKKSLRVVQRMNKEEARIGFDKLVTEMPKPFCKQINEIIEQYNSIMHDDT